MKDGTKEGKRGQKKTFMERRTGRKEEGNFMESSAGDERRGKQN